MAYRVTADHLRMIYAATAKDTQIGERGREFLLKIIDGQAVRLGVEKLKMCQENYANCNLLIKQPKRRKQRIRQEQIRTM